MIKHLLIFSISLFIAIAEINGQTGSSCEDPIALSSYGIYYGIYDDTWFVYTPDTNGTYNISTCDLASCDTKIWVYENCPSSLFENAEGSYAYNDDFCGLGSFLNLTFTADHTYIIRIGDYNGACDDSISTPFQLTKLPPVTGCMDSTACNYNPSAEIEGPCAFFPSPDCMQPDLVLNSETLLSNMYMTTSQANNCNIEEGIVTGEGLRTVITFTVRIDNTGQADYYIGDPVNNPQMFDTQNCHGHTHYAGYGDYRLMDMQGNIIPAGHKNGFCVMDLCGFGQYNCGQMGISAGCFDQYGAGTDGQWFDVTEVPDGTYRGLVTVNPLHLPDALNHEEMDYENNTFVFCFDLFTDGDGTRGFTVLGDCPTFIDCNGQENGIAQQDCNGICNGSSIWGDVTTDSQLNVDDQSEYLNILSTENIDVTTCNDLSGNGSLTIYDLSLAHTCMEESSQAGTSACDFPQNILSTSATAGMAISDVNFVENYIDIELKSNVFNIVAYQFMISGISISNLVSLADPNSFNCAIGFNPYTNSVYALGMGTDSLAHNATPWNVIRIYFNQITDNTICISGITDIVNDHRARVANYIYGNCVDATEFSVGEISTRADIALMPNPVNQSAYIQLSRFESNPKFLVVQDNLGRMAMTIQIPSGSQRFEVDFSNLNAGIYTISADGNSAGAYVRRFVKL